MNSPPGKKMGRPPAKDPKTTVIQIRVSPKQKEEIRGIAQRLKMSISELILYSIRKLKD